MRKLIWAGSAAVVVAMGFVFACGSDETGITEPTADSATPTGDSSQPAVDSSVLKPDASLDATTTPDATADADAAPDFTPAILGARLVLWLEGDSFALLDGGIGAVWPDKSAAGNNAFQEAGARTPVLIDAGTEGGVNGHSVVHFAGNEFMRIADSASLQWGAGDFAFYVIMRHFNNVTTMLPEYGIVYAKWTDTGPSFPGFFMWANYPASTGYTSRLDDSQALKSDSGLNDGVVRLVGTRRSGANYELRVGGNRVDLLSDASVPNQGGFNAAGLSAFIGGRESTIQQLQGDIAEIIAVKGALADAEQTALEGYLKSKYGL